MIRFALRLTSSFFLALSCTVCFFLMDPLFASNCFAGNGIFQTGYGLPARAMGGAATGLPLSPIDAIAFNPAGLTRFTGFTFDSATTLTDNPTVNGTVTSDVSDVSLTGHLQHGLFLLPASALSYRVGRIAGGFGAISYAGSGSDWRNTDLKEFFDSDPPLNSDISSFVGIVRLSPSIAYLVTDRLSLGASFDVNIIQMDLGHGMGLEYCFGFSFGILWSPMRLLSVGVSYTNETTVDVGRVLYVPDLTTLSRGDGRYTSVEVNSPRAVRTGIAFTPIEQLVLAFDYKWYNYSHSFEAQDWQDVNVFSVGIQYRIRDVLALRAGYTWHNQPIKEHNGWDPTDPAAVVSEYLRTFSTPLSMRRNLTLGFGITIRNMEVHFAYEKTFLSRGTSTSADRVLEYAVEFDQDHYSFGFTIHF